MIEQIASGSLDILWSVTWQSALMFSVVWAVCKWVPKIPAKVRAWLWWLVAAKMVLSFLFVGGVPLRLLPSQESPLAFLNHRMDLLAPPVTAPTPTGKYLQIVAGANAGIPEPVQDHRSAWSLVAGIWGFGALCSLLFLAKSGLHSWKLVRTSAPIQEGHLAERTRRLGVAFGLSNSPKLHESDQITTPMVVGLINPIVLLPKGFSASFDDDEVGMSLAHELAHIHRRDLLLALVPATAQCLLFFLPFPWLIRKNWETEREAACDAEALSITQVQPSAYGRLLLKIVSTDARPSYPLAIGATANYHSLKERLSRMNTHNKMPLLGKPLAALLIGTGLLMALPWQLSAQIGNETKNVVRNGGFENGASSWAQGTLPPNANVPVTISEDKSTKKSGQASLMFEKTEQRYFPVALMAQQIPFDGKAKRLKVGVWIKASDVKKFTLAVIMRGGEGKIEWGAFVGDKDGGGKSYTHDWKYYTSVVAIPDDADEISLALQMYGPGTVWADDVSASYVPDSTPVTSSIQDSAEDADADVKDVPNEERKVGNDPRMKYFLIGKGKEPANGYKVLVVLPGGDGSAEFNPFVRKIWKAALPEGYLIAELVAPKWSDEQFEQIVWPTNKQRWATMKFSTEQFIEAVLGDIKKVAKVDASKVYSLSWSSGGPAAYAASLTSPSIKGSFVAMSVYKPDQLPPLSGAKDRAYYLLHSPTDFIPIAQPKLAQSELEKAGAKTTLTTYEGGHGWHGDIFGSIRKGVDWLEANSK